MKGLYSGSQIVSLKSRSQQITRSQTASQAYNAILKKYGEVRPHAHYFHVGKGVWHEWSMERDKQRTGKIASSKLEWAERPNKFDWPGIDTKEGSKKRSYSVTSIKHPSKLSGRKSKSVPTFVGEHVTKEIKRPKLTLSAIKLPTKPSHRKEKVQLKGSGKGVLKHININKSKSSNMDINDIKMIKGYSFSSVKKLITTASLNQKQIVILRDIERMFKSPDRYSRLFLIKHGYYGEIADPYATGIAPKDIMLLSNISYRIDHPKIAPSSGKRVNRDKLSLAERAPAVPTKPVEKRISPEKTVTINGKQYKINASNALAFLTELKNKQSKNKLASMIKQAKAKELKGKDVSDDWANIVTFISQNMGATNLKRLPTTASGYARFMGKKNDYQKINEKAYQIKKRDEEIEKNLGSVEKVKANLKYAQDLLTRAEKDMVDLKKQLKDAEENYKKGKGTYDLVQLLKREIEKQKYEIKEDKYLVEERTKKLEARTPKPHPNNKRVRLARATLPKYSLSMVKQSSKLSNRKEKRVLNISKKPLYKNVPIPSGKYRYASFMRPLGMWFNPGVTFKIESVTNADRDLRFNRMPHSVISTGKPLSKNVVDKFELTDLAEGKRMEELIKYMNKFDFLNSSMKNQLESLILKGKDKAYIDQYIDKARKMAEKKGNPATTPTYTSPKQQPTTLKEINVRLDELKPILKPFYESNRKPTPDEALAVKEADALVRKRDGIIARSEIAYKKKELASKTTSYTDKSVRDLPQKASVYNGLITVNSYVGRKLAGSYNLNIDTWIKTERFGNPAYNKAELINRAFKGDGAGGEAQRQRIIDSQISAIDHVMKMLK